MARYRKIDPRMWGDEKFRSLSKPQPNAQTLWQYLLTGPHTNGLPGLYNVGLAALAENLEWSLEGLSKRFRELLDKEMVKYDPKVRVVLIPKALSYDPPANPNVVKFWGKLYDVIPNCEIKNEFYQILKLYLEGLQEPLRERFMKPFREGYRDSITITITTPLPLPKEDLTPGCQGDTLLGQPDEIVFLFNETVKYLPKVSRTRSRDDKMRTRLKEHRERNWWKTVFEKADNILIPSKVKGQKDWSPTFDWLIDNDKNAVKVFEGNYDDSKRINKSDYRDAKDVLKDQGFGEDYFKLGEKWKNPNE